MSTLAVWILWAYTSAGLSAVSVYASPNACARAENQLIAANPSVIYVCRAVRVQP